MGLTISASVGFKNPSAEGPSRACKICVLKVKKKVVACVERGSWWCVQFVFFHFLKACKLYIQYILYVLFM